MTTIRYRHYKRKGYSLLEMLITLLIVNIITLMLSNILVISLRTSLEIRERSASREELTTIINLMKRDARNSDSVNCLVNNSQCTFTKENEAIIWKICPVDGINHICQEKVEIPPPNSVLFRSSSRLNITNLKFVTLSQAQAERENTQDVISITITADHTNETLDIRNLYRQAVVATRNYTL